jgi:hypothetical protein
MKHGNFTGGPELTLTETQFMARQNGPADSKGDPQRNRDFQYPGLRLPCITATSYTRSG